MEQYEQALNDGLNAIDEAIENAERLDIDAVKEGTTTTVTITKQDGTTKEADILDGEKGDKGDKGDKGKKGETGAQGPQGIQGEQGPMGPQGEAFTIKKTYSSVAQMNADFNNMNVGDYVMIANSVETEDNAKLYTRGEYAWIFITDFSGATGIQGEQGPQGPQGIQGPQGVQGIQGVQGETGNGIASVVKTGTSGLVDTYTITYTDGTTTTFTVTNGKGISSITKISSVGLIDTYRVTFNDGTTFDYEVTNGEDGEVTQAQLDEVQAELDRYKLLENALPHTENETASDYVTLNNTVKAPMEIETIPQTSQETTTGKNLANISIIGSVPSVSNGQLVPLANGATTDLIMIDNTKEYTLSYVLETSGTCFVFFYDENESYLGNNENIQSGYNLTSSQYFSNSKYLRLRFGSYANFSNIQLEEGSTVTSYEPYTGTIPAPNPDYPMDIHCTTGENQVKVVGKNICSDVSLGINAQNLLFYFDKKIIARDFTLSFTSNVVLNDNSVYLIINGSNIGRISTISTNSNMKATATISLSEENYNALKESNTVYIQVYKSGATFVPPNDTQIENSSSATSYTPYEETTYQLSLGNIEMFNINGVYDGFVYDEALDKFYIERKNGKVVLNGSEDWLLQNNTFVYNQANSKREYYQQTRTITMMCDCFIGQRSSFRDAIKNLHVGKILNDTNQIGIRYLGKTLEEFIDILDRLKPILVFQLNTSTLEEITDTTLISQLRAIKNALSMQGATHVISTASGSNLPFLIKARAIQNIVNS